MFLQAGCHRENISLDSLDDLERHRGQPRVPFVGFWWRVFLWQVTDIGNSGGLDGKTEAQLRKS